MDGPNFTANYVALVALIGGVFEHIHATPEQRRRAQEYFAQSGYDDIVIDDKEPLH